VSVEVDTVIGTRRDWYARDLEQLMLLADVPSIATIPSNLLAIATAREAPHANGHPPQRGHDFGQTAARASTSASLRNFQDVEHGLSCNALDAVVVDFTVQPFQRQSPRIGVSCGHFGLRLS
jgi:hypothetical protein